MSRQHQSVNEGRNKEASLHFHILDVITQDQRLLADIVMFLGHHHIQNPYASNYQTHCCDPTFEIHLYGNLSSFTAVKRLGTIF